MKMFELTVDKRGIHFRCENPDPLSADHKFCIALALIITPLLAELMWLMAGH